MTAAELQQKKQLNRRADRLNLNINSIMQDDDGSSSNSVTYKAKPANPNKTIRSKKEGLQFDLTTWGVKKKHRTAS